MHFLRLAIVAAIMSVGFVRSAGTAAQPQTKSRLVEEIVVVGYRRLEREEILSHISTRAGDPFNEESIQRDFQQLLALGLFNKLHSRVTVEDGLRGGMVVIFEVYELPLIESVKFYGLPDGVSESEIISALAAAKVNIGKGAVIDQPLLQKAKRLIARELAAHGWPNSGVETSFEYLASQSVTLTIAISLRF